MADFKDVVKELKEVNQKLATAGGVQLDANNPQHKSLIAAIEKSSVGSSLASAESKKQRENSTKESDDIEKLTKNNTKVLSKKLDKFIGPPEMDNKDDKFIGPPEMNNNTSGAGEEEKNDRMKALSEAFTKSSVGKGILSISKSIGGFIGGMTSTVKGGAMMFLKGIISATVLGLIIKFLKSDMFKEFLSEENLKKLADFFKNFSTYLKDAFTFIADPENRKSIAYALAAFAFAKMGGLSLIGGALMSLGGLFSLGGIFGKKSIAAANSGIASSKKGGGKFMKFLKAGALIGLAISAFDGVKAAQDSYMKGNKFGKIVADGVGGIVNSLTFGIIDAQKISKFLSPSDSIKVSKKEADIRLLEKSIDADGTTPAIKILKEKKIEQLKSELETFKKDSQKRADLKVKKQDERLSQEEFDMKRKKFIAEGTAIDRLLGKGKNMSQRRKEGIITSGNFAQIKYGKKFDEKFGKENPQLKLDAIENLEKKKIKELKVIKKNEDEQKMLDLLAKRKQKDVELLGGRTNTFGTGATINNTTIVNQKGGDSKIENKTIMTKPVRNQSIPEQYLISTY